MSINPTPLTPRTKNKISSLIVMASVAVVLGLVAAGGIWQYLNQAQEKVKKLSVTRAVVVASMQIPAGTKLSDSDLAIKQLPEQTVPKDYPSSIESIKGRIVKTTIQPEEVITEARLVGLGAAGGLTVVIPPGYRAFTMKVNDVIGVGGFINPGDRVDVISILQKDDQRTFSKTILQNVLVLAVGDKILDPNNFAEPLAMVVAQVTLAVNAKDSEKLALASQIGQLHLSLRAHGEEKLASTEGIKLEDLYGYLAYVPPPNQNASGNVPLPVASTSESKLNRNSIEVILGDERSYFYY